ncbi:ATP-binding protein, partial [Aquabacterium sp.]|uniref:ATP-binding protein n=1 Tax=Aquabacterium sp. TaxID=1872578 RepID=UPI002C29977B
MDRLIRLGLGSKLTLAFAALAAVTLLVVLLAFVAGRNAIRDIELTEQVRSPVWVASEQAQASLLKVQLHVRGYLVLGDPADIDHYRRARQDFEKSLAALQAMSSGRPDDTEARWVAELTQIYQRWADLPLQLFDLHDNPLKNRPALRIGRVELQALRVRVLDEIDILIGLQKAREPTPRNGGPMSELLAFQTSFDALTTNLMAYAASGELNFKLTYGPQLATNATIWNSLSARRPQLSAAQRARLDAIARHRAEIAEHALQIVAILNGEHAREDLYLYRTQVAPQAEAMIVLLGQVTSRQQAQLKSELARARGRLADASTYTMAGGLAAVVLGVVMAFAFRRRIVGPVQRLTGVAERVAGGDLSARATVETQDEIGVLATSFNTMTERLAHSIEHLEAVFAEAQRAKDAAIVANRAKSTFLATMSHELRTPLNAILGYAQILLYDKALDDQQIAGLHTIQRSGEHLLRLINDILDLSRIEAGKIDLRPEPVSLAAFLRAITDIICIKAEEKGLQFSFDDASGLTSAVLFDEQRLRQVLLNLLSNAVKFTEQGNVSLRLRPLATGEHSVTLRFEVEDSGIGIPPAQHRAIFEPFEQAADVQRHFGGTGLGLSISRQLVRLMGSDIQLDSQVGQGSRFWFDLALPTTTQAARGEASLAPLRPVGYRGETRKLLIVDDVAANRALLVSLLSPLGFKTLQADNGAAALQQAQAQAPDLIMMDSVMPGMDGLEATRQIRQQPSLRQVPIIVVSASASAADQQASREVGASAFLPKPIALDALLHQIGRLLQLDWIVDKAAAQPADTAAPAALVPPPTAEMDLLYGLAQTGNMSSIRAHADHIESLGTRYAAFAQRLRELADRYQSRAILDLARKFMEPPG